MRSLMIFIFLFVNVSIYGQKKLYDYPIGIQAYTMRNHWSKGVEPVLETLQKLGIEVMEAGLPAGMTADEYLKLLAKYDIQLKSIGADYQSLKNKPEEVVKNAKALGVNYVMCSWIPHKGHDFTMENAQEAVEVFNKAGKILKDAGIYFCYHGHGYEFRPSTASKGNMMEYILDNTDPKSVYFELDVLWNMHGGGADMPQYLLKKYPGRYKLMHIKDLKKGVVGDFTGGTPSENDVVIGSGQANWRKIFKLARKSGIEYCFLEDESNHELEHLPLSIEYLKNLK